MAILEGKGWRGWIELREGWFSIGNGRENKTGAQDGEVQTCGMDVEAKGETEAVAEDGCIADGQDRASATQLSAPGRWMMLLVNSLM